jgi:SAM-dependent methyltransferase
MLKQATHKVLPHWERLIFSQLDAESLPYQDNSFDAVLSGMTFGVLPNQEQALAEMIRVVKGGGLVCVGAHGSDHYWEAIDASLRCITKRYILGYRLEWWPRSESYIRGLLENANLDRIHSKRVIWRNEFESGSAAYDFFAAISASWWYAKFPPDKIMEDSLKTRDYFERKNIRFITDDIVVAYGHKPLSDPDYPSK